jgi:hypothetical protein
MTDQHRSIGQNALDQNASAADPAAVEPRPPTRTDEVAPDYSVGIRQRILIIDGCFLALVATVQVTLEVLAHFFGIGPYAGIFARSPYTIGWVEAHGLAAMIGVLLLAAGIRDRRRFWHAFALGVHLLLGAANLVFWQSFVEFATVPLGELSTAAHLLFATAQGWSLVVSRREDRS